jgi:hypothetical protein
VRRFVPAVLWMVLGMPGVVHAGPSERPASAEATSARERQLIGQMNKLTARNAWNGLEEAWLELVALGTDLSPEALMLGADSARNRGDAWQSYQRLLNVLRARPEDAVAAGQMAIFRSAAGGLPCGGSR